MKIGISALFLKPAGIGGTEHMLRALLSGFSQLDTVEVVIFGNAELRDWFAYLADSKSTTIVPVRIMGNRFISELVQLPCLVRKYQLTACIFPNYFTPFFLGIPCITVIHDLNYLYFPEMVSQLKRWWLQYAHFTTLAHASKVVAISEFVKQDIIHKYQPKSAKKLLVIPNPIAWSRFTIVSPPPYIPDGPFILTVAYHYRHKNLAVLIKAFALLLSSWPDSKLVLVGQLAKNISGIRSHLVDDISHLVDSLSLREKVIVTGYISDPELAWYYRHATVFAFPSQFEGFGLPPVEALGMGLPVVTTRCTAIPEVTLGLAQYVDDPLTPQAWVEALLPVMQEPAKFVPSPSAIEQIRSTYNPQTIAQEYVKLIMSLP